MTAARRSNLVTAAIFFAALLLFSLLFARLAGAGIDAGDLTVADAGVDRVVLADHAEPVDAGPYRIPAVVDRAVAADHADPGAYLPPPPAPSGMSADTLTWGYIKAGGGASVVMRALFWIGTALLASKERLAQRWPKLATGRNLAIVSSVVGAMLTLGRGAALSGAPLTWLALGEAVMSAILLVTWPQPKVVAGQAPSPVPAP